MIAKKSRRLSPPRLIEVRACEYDALLAALRLADVRKALLADRAKHIAEKVRA